MDIETEPTDEQLAELLEYVGAAVRAETEELEAMARAEVAKVTETSPAYGILGISRS